MNIHDAKTHFAKLIPIAPEVRDRRPGSARGAFVVPPDFDEPLPDEVLADWR